MSGHAGREPEQLDQVEELLLAYAGARLSPSGPLLARMRAAVLLENASAAATSAAERRAVATGAARPARWNLTRLHVPRRAVALGMAATMTLGTGAAVLAAPPGSPFYGARVALETAFLPLQADARLASHEEHLEQRLAEAQAAAVRGDAVALEAALVAYAAEVNAAVGEIGDDAARLARLEAVLGLHVTVLTALEARVPEEASVDKALESSRKAVERIKETGIRGGGRPTEVPSGPVNQPARQ